MSETTLPERVATVEARIEAAETRLGFIETTMMKLHTAVFDIKERIDKQNGQLPFIVDSIKEIKTNLETIKTKSTENGVKVSAMWAVVRSNWRWIN